MLENLLSLVRESAEDAIVSNPAIPNQFNDAAIKETTDQIVGGLKHQFETGNVSGLLGLVNGGTSNLASNPIVTQIITSLTQSLASKFGISTQQANNAASMIIGSVLPKLISKINDPNDKSFDLAAIAKELGGGGLGGMMGGLFGGGLGKLFG